MSPTFYQKSWKANYSDWRKGWTNRYFGVFCTFLAHFWKRIELCYTFFIRTSKFWLSLSVLIVLLSFGLICSYFVLVTIIIFDLALHICIFIIHTENFWLILAGLKETFYISILKFVYITFCLLTEPQTMLQLESWWHKSYFNSS